jgi:TolB-like protein/Tfp pilus assembly protein PilF
MVERNADIPESRQITLRIGVNLGDIIIDGDDIYGDGVNVAARLEGLSKPGGVCTSGTVFEHVKGKLDVSFDDLGPQEVKNIAEPVRVYQWSVGKSEMITDTQRDDIPTLAGKPSIAVLPFDNLSGDPEQEYFSDGITEDIITALSHIRQFFVIARNTTFTYKGQAVDVQAVARELGVRYVLEGSVRKAGNRVRITAQLIDGETGSHLWAERYDRDLEDIFEVQDEITRTVVGTLGPELSRAEQERSRHKAPENMNAWDFYQRGLWHLWRFEKNDNAEARALLQRATEIDPSLSPAFAALAFTHIQDFFMGFTDNPAAAIEGATQRAEQALKLDGREATAYTTRGQANLIRRDHPAARNDLNAALNIDPSYALAHMTMGMSYTYCNQLDDAIPYFDDAERLSPKDPMLWVSLMGRALAFLIEGEFEDADAVGKRAIGVPNAPLVPRLIHAAALGQLGHIEEAQAEIDVMLKINPGFCVSFVDRILPTYEEKVRNVILDGLRKAGVSES